MTHCPIVIPCSGLGTRMNGITNNSYPKIMIRADETQTLLEKIIKLALKQNVPKVYLIALSKEHKEIMLEHLNAFLDVPKDFVEIVVYPRSDGSYNAIKYLTKIKPALAHTGIMCMWSDLNLDCIPMKPVHTSKDKVIVYYDDTNRQYGWFVDINSKISKDKNNKGNIPGLYYIPTKMMHTVFSPQFKNNFDLIQVLSTYIPSTEIRTVPWKILDFGDVEKFNENYKSVETMGRWFNFFREEELWYYKTSLDRFGMKAIKNEGDFYKEIVLLTPYLFPKIGHISNNQIKMQKLDDYKTVFQEYNENIWHSKSRILKLVNSALIHLHNIEYSDSSTRIEKINSSKKEYIDKTLMRLNDHYSLLKVKYLVDPILNSEKILNKQIHTAKFTVVHSDPNAENIMINKKGSIKFIDPKGTFGNHKIIGDPLYDYAKFIYGLVFFNEFDNDNDGMIDYDKWRNKFNKIDNDISNLCRQLGIEKYNLEIGNIIGLICLSLPKFVKQDINKMLIARDLGKYLLQQYK